MSEQFPLFSIENFPCLQRIFTFLANCGLPLYSIGFFDPIGWRYPFTKSKQWFELDDEVVLQQKERASLHENVQIARVFGYSLELDHGLYRLRYSLISTGRRQLIRDLLAGKGITQYEIIDETNEGRMLPPYKQFNEIEDCSGTLVTPTSVCDFWLDWMNGRHTLGDESYYHYDGEKHCFWREYPLNGEHEHSAEEVEGARIRLLLRKHIVSSEPNGVCEMWEIREEDAKQFFD